LIRRKHPQSIRADKRANGNNGDGWAMRQDFVEPNSSNESSLCNFPLLGLSSQEIPVPSFPYRAVLETPLYGAPCFVLGTGKKREKSTGSGLRNTCRAGSVKMRNWADKSR